VNAPPPPRAQPVNYRQWGEGLEHEAVMQMEKACLLPVAVTGALMPDAHVGYVHNHSKRALLTGELKNEKRRAGWAGAGRLTERTEVCADSRAGFLFFQTGFL
jgi:hypothetical protein